MEDASHLDNCPDEVMFLAKALYDNVAETPDELACRRGDVLTIIEVEPSNLEGWWLCSLRGRRGIIAANRLRSLAGSTDPGGGRDSNSNKLNYPNYDNTMQMNAQMGGVSWKQQQFYNQSNKMGAPDTPQIYKQPHSSDYDIPKAKDIAAPEPPPPRGYSTASLGRSSHTSLLDADTYDVPRASLLSDRSSLADDNGTYDVPKSHAYPNSKRASSASSVSASSLLPPSGRTSVDPTGHDVYDIPRAPQIALPPTPVSPPVTEDSKAGGPSVMYDILPKARDAVDKLKESTEADQGSDDCYSEISDIPMKQESTHRIDSGYDAGDYVDDYAFPKKSIVGESSKISLQNKDSGFMDDCVKTRTLSSGDDYDVPQSNKGVGTTTSHIKQKMETLKMRTSDPHAIYDIPPQVTKDCGRFSSELGCRLSGASSHSGSGGDDDLDASYEQLRLDLDSALDLLVKLQQEVHSSCTRLLGYVNPKWRLTENLEPKLYSVRVASLSIKTSLQEYIEFMHGVLANAKQISDSGLRIKLVKSLRPLQDDHQVVIKHLKAIEVRGWTVAALMVPNQNEALKQNDELDGVVAKAREIPARARSLTLLIQGNAKSLFASHASPLRENVTLPPSNQVVSPPIMKTRPSLAGNDGMKTRPLPPPPNPVIGAKESQESNESSGQYDTYSLPRPHPKHINAADKPTHDYDYVQLTKQNHNVSTTSLCMENITSEELRRLSENDLSPPKVRTSGLSPKFKERIEALQREAEKPVRMHTQTDAVPTTLSHSSLSQQCVLHENDQLILQFYRDQVAAHCTVLGNATQAFMQCLEYQQPPKVFIAHSKFVVLAAHKLVYIGDTITRNLLNDEIRSKIMVCGNSLCDKLKATVVATKNAALSFPSNELNQEMADKVTDVSIAAAELNRVITLHE